MSNDITGDQGIAVGDTVILKDGLTPHTRWTVDSFFLAAQSGQAWAILASADSMRITAPVSSLVKVDPDAAPLNPDALPGLITQAAAHAERPRTPLTILREAVERAVEAMRAAQAPTVEQDPITAKELRARIADQSLDNLFDLDNELTDRIVRRAKYDALNHFLHVLDGWIMGDRTFDADDIRSMVNDAARELSVPEPWRDEATS